ncbi:hypothetical protein BGX27_008091 [Mortierella sp. AM989]|nr:hypothetical protein BGX27_008091 [Mortierella sp. AM989]
MHHNTLSDITNSSHSGRNPSQPNQDSHQLSFPTNNHESLVHDSQEPSYSLGDLNIIFSFLSLEKAASLSVEPQLQLETDTNSGSNSNNNDGDLGDLSRILRYLQAHKTPSPHPQQETHIFPTPTNIINISTNTLATDSASHSHDEPFVLTSPDISSLVKPTGDATAVNPSQDAIGALLGDDDYSESSVSRRRTKKRTRNELPIDEPSSCSGGGWISSESDHKEGLDTVAESDNTKASDIAFTKALAQELESQSSHVSRTIIPKKRRPWRSERVLKEMKALFVKEQQQLQQQQKQKDEYHRHQQLQTKQASPKSTSLDRDEELSSQKEDGGQDSIDFEVVMEQIPGCEPTLARRPRTHNKNFWRTACEEEQGLESGALNIEDNAQTPTTSTQCLSEEQSIGKRLLAMRVRDTFLVPIGKQLRDQALSQADIGGIAATQSSSAEKSRSSNTTRSECASTKTLVRVEAEHLTLKTTEETIEEEEMSSRRVFIFVDNSNILTGFYQFQQKHAAQNENNITSKQQSTRSSLSHERCASPDLQCPPQTDSIDGGSATESIQRIDTDSEEEIILYTRNSRDSAKALKNDRMDGFTSESMSMDPNPLLEKEKEELQSTPTIQKISSGARMVKGVFPKFDYSAFFNFLRRNRYAARQVLVGSSPLFQELDEALEHHYETIILRRVRKFVQGELGALPIPIKQLRYPCNVMEGGAFPLASLESVREEACASQQSPVAGSRGEQGVDELLHLKMLETLLDHEPATMVLATGDGGDSEFGGGGFYGVIKRALDRGWQVEVVSWEDQLSGVYLELALEYGYECTDVRKGRHHRRQTSEQQQQHQQRQHPHQHRKHHSGRQRGCHGEHCTRGHLRVWCLDWYKDRFLSSAND